MFTLDNDGFPTNQKDFGWCADDGVAIYYTVVPDTTYYFQIGSENDYYSGDPGRYEFTLLEGDEPLISGIPTSGSPEPSQPPAPTPDNNVFGNAVKMDFEENNSKVVTGMDLANNETGEPLKVQDIYYANGTRWYKYTNGDSGEDITVDTIKGTDTLLAVYTGNAVNNLIYITGNRFAIECSGSVPCGSSVYFYAEANTTYYFQVAFSRYSNPAPYMLGPDAGTIYINLRHPESSLDQNSPANDDIEDATDIEIDVMRTSDYQNPGYAWNEAYTHEATMEVGEPGDGDGLVRTVWYKWTNDATQRIVWLDTAGNDKGRNGPGWIPGTGVTLSNLSDTILDVYTAQNPISPDVSELTSIAHNDDWNYPLDQTDKWGLLWMDSTSFTYFTAEPDTTYYFRIAVRSDVIWYRSIPVGEVGYPGGSWESLPVYFTARTKPIEAARELDTPDGGLWCSNNGGPLQTIPYQLAKGGVSLDGWYDCWSWCNANMTDEAPLCQMNGDSPRSCWIVFPPLGGVDNCIWENWGNFPKGAYMGENNGFTLTLPEGLSGYLYNQPSVDVSKYKLKGLRNVQIRDSSTNAPLADIFIDFSQNLDWTTDNVVSGGAFPGFGKAFTHNFTNAQGASDKFDLYIPIPQGAASSEVRVCPGAGTLEAVVPACNQEELIPIDDERVEKVTVNGLQYWKVFDVTGTGGQTIISDFNVYDTMTRQEISTPSNHDIFFGTTYGLETAGNTITVTFPVEFDLTDLTFGDISLLSNSFLVDLVDGSASTDHWGVTIDKLLNTIVFTAPSTSGYIDAESILELKIYNAGIAPIINPDSVALYTINIEIDNVVNGGPEDGTMDVAIVDSDQVIISGYVSNYINFDIDVGNSAAINCDYNSCKTHSSSIVFGDNYTVDLGELSWTRVNKSHDYVMHSDGIEGFINSIYFDITSNAISGSVVNVLSEYGALQSASTTINAVSDEANITSNSNTYGYNFPLMASALHGTVVFNSKCDTEATYCGPISTGQKLVFNTSGGPIDQARVRMDIAAAPAFTNNPGTYTDTLTFVATGTF